MEAQKQIQFSIINTDNPKVLASLKYKRIFNSSIQINKELMVVKITVMKMGQK